MHPNEYQSLARRTRCNQSEVFPRLAYLSSKLQMTTQRLFQKENDSKEEHRVEVLLHGFIGLTGEVGELASAIEKYGWYKQEFDRVNVIEELGDCLWYVSELCDGLGIDLETVMRLNIDKLKKRFPEKFTTEAAAEENRKRSEEVSSIRRMIAEDDGASFESC
jgi:NTP pyrophosphatase (non-canonical NTP hydrolase)